MWDLIVSVPDHCLSFYFVIVTVFVVSCLLGRVLAQCYDELCQIHYIH